MDCTILQSILLYCTKIRQIAKMDMYFSTMPAVIWGLAFFGQNKKTVKKTAFLVLETGIEPVRL